MTLKTSTYKKQFCWSDSFHWSRGVAVGNKVITRGRSLVSSLFSKDIYSPSISIFRFSRKPLPIHPPPPPPPASTRFTLASLTFFYRARKSKGHEQSGNYCEIYIEKKIKNFKTRLFSRGYPTQMIKKTLLEVKYKKRRLALVLLYGRSPKRLLCLGISYVRNVEKVGKQVAYWLFFVILFQFMF